MSHAEYSVAHQFDDSRQQPPHALRRYYVFRHGSVASGSTEALIDALVKTHERVFRRLPHDPRCMLCQNPFGGIGGKLVGVMGRKPSRKNPNVCQSCFDKLPSGGIEIDIGVVFADVRGSTTIGERSTATEFAARLNKFYATASDVLIHHDALVDKLIGDEVMGLFIRGLAGSDYRRKTALAAVDLAIAVDDLPVGVAASAGIAPGARRIVHRDRGAGVHRAGSRAELSAAL